MNTRKGMGKGLGCGYKNIAPMDAHIHSLSAKGEKTYVEKVFPSGALKISKGHKKQLYMGYSKRDALKKFKSLNARGDMHTIQLDPEYSVVMYSEGTRNGFKHVAILMQNGSEREKASVSYLNRTWESYEFQTVLHKLFDKAFDKDKSKIIKTDLDKVSGRSLMAKGKKKK